MLLTTTFLVCLAVMPASVRAEMLADRALPGTDDVADAQTPPPPPAPPRPRPAPRPAPAPHPTGAQLTDRVVREVELGPNGHLDLANIAGDIVITGAKGTGATIEIIKAVHTRPALSDQDAREMLDLVQVDVVERGNRVEVRTHYGPRGRGAQARRNFHVTVAYQVAAPIGTRIRARSVSGSITATGIQGESSYESVSGAVKVVNGGRVASAKSISGAVEVVDTAMDSSFQASSASGSVILRRVKARRADVSAISGAIVLDEVQVERLDAQTVSGHLQLDGTLRPNDRIQLRSHSGNVQVALAGAPGFDLDATTFSGAVRTDLPVTARPGENGPGRSRVLRGVHGDGSAVLELTTFSGNIVIRKR